MDLGNIVGQMEENMKVSGKIIVCMEKVNIFGKMEECIKDNIFKIKNTDLENILGQMEKFIKEIGKMVYSMEKEN